MANTDANSKAFDSTLGRVDKTLAEVYAKSVIGQEAPDGASCGTSSENSISATSDVSSQGCS